MLVVEDVVGASEVVGASDVEVTSVDWLLSELQPEMVAVETSVAITRQGRVERKRTLVSLAGG